MLDLLIIDGTNAFASHQAFGREIKREKRQISLDEKKQVLIILRQMVYALSEEVYDGLHAQLLGLNLDGVTQYFDTNWHRIRTEWVACYTKQYHHYLNQTTNRLESLNSKLKSVVTKYTTLQNFFAETIQFLKSTVTESDYRTISKKERKPIVIVTAHSSI